MSNAVSSESPSAAPQTRQTFVGRSYNPLPFNNHPAQAGPFFDVSRATMVRQDDARPDMGAVRPAICTPSRPRAQLSFQALLPSRSIDVITSAKRTPLLRSLLAAALLATVAALPTISRSRTTAFRAAATAAPPTDTGATVSGSAAFAEPLVFAIHPTRPARDPTGEREPLAHMLRPRLAAHQISPRTHGASFPSTLSCATVSSASPWRRRTASSLPTITVVAAPRRADCVSCPLRERAA